LWGNRGIAGSRKIADIAAIAVIGKPGAFSRKLSYEQLG
jgi:hypothetical protein